MLVIRPEYYNDLCYNGSESKCGVTIEGVNYILKRQKRNWHNVYSEHIASSIINILGGCAHETKLALEGNSVVVLCKDFTDSGGALETLSAINSSSIDTDVGRHPYYFIDVMYLLKSIQNVSKDVISRFIEMYVFDTLLGNTDRHCSNWGLCNNSGLRTFAPIFDNGASLFPRANWCDLHPDWLRERTVVWPNSKIMFGNKGRSSYYNVWRSGELPAYAYAYAEALEIQSATEWLQEQSYLSEEAKRFYSIVIECRYNAILLRKDVAYDTYC